MVQPLENVRQQIDTIDTKIHDLLMERAGLVLQIGAEKKKKGMPIIQPHRETAVLRRILARHEGPLPRESVIRIWRELMGAVSLLQTGLKVAVNVPEGPAGVTYWDLAKDYFSSVLPMTRLSNPFAALAAVREGEASFAVLPWPEDGEKNPWWAHMMEESPADGLHVVARLPFGDPAEKHENPTHRALVVMRGVYEASDADRSFVLLRLPSAVSRARLVEKADDSGLTVRAIWSADQPGSDSLHLLEVTDYVSREDDRPGLLLEKLEAREGLCVSIGGYPRPPVYGDKVGKNAITGQNGSF